NRVIEGSNGPMGVSAELSSLEEKVMMYLMSGLTVTQTAEELMLSDLTITSVLTAARCKLAAKTNLQAMAQFALQRNTGS
ncbi:MAG: hypothetical protein KDJ69_07105, partial [Nitratireductor sp.]|nr:hypothetical protein [Nitratireductor sp.]